ncbi:MAG: hypothetical protein ACRDGR_04675, partial [bacterium]
MMRTGRILLVEPEDDIRRDLDRQLDQAGHDVAAVPDASDAARLLEEGLDPDVVVLGGDDAGSGTLRRLAPRAAHLRIDRAARRVRGFEDAGDAAFCVPDPAEVLRRVEELLLRHHPPLGSDPGSRCLDLARRLANALPRARSVEERIALVTDAFDSFFGVRGTLVVRRRASGGWIEATQAVSNAVVERIEKEIARRSRTRDIRPFLTRLVVDGAAHEVACVAIGLGGGRGDRPRAGAGARAEPAGPARGLDEPRGERGPGVGRGRRAGACAIARGDPGIEPRRAAR